MFNSKKDEERLHHFAKHMVENGLDKDYYRSLAIGFFIGVPLAVVIGIILAIWIL